MPNLNVYLPAGHSAAQKEALLTRMSAVVADSLAAPIASVRIFLVELPLDHVCVGGVTLAAEARAGGPVSPGGPTIHAFLVAGRSQEKKAALIAGVTQVVGDVLAIPPAPVRVMIFDVANTDFGMQGVTAKSLGR
mgnify:CR=1 FL=1